MYSSQFAPLLSCENMTPTELKMFRQGDILLLEQQHLPKYYRSINAFRGRIVLQKGKSGHEHAMSMYDDVSFIRDILNNKYIIVSRVAADLTHPEHNTISVPVGIYKVILQRQQFSEKVRLSSD